MVIKTVDKGWGQEIIWADTDRYCGKFLNFREGSRFSMHFHRDKDETWYVLSGVFDITWIDTVNATEHQKRVATGDTWRNMPLMPHQVHCIESGSIIEVSSADSPQDNYRVRPGDSQSTP